MFAQERQRRIEQKVRMAGRVTVAALARDFDITTETIRRDLASLERSGVLQRVHGGAVPAHLPSLDEPTFDDREVHHLEQKTAIAAAALGLLEDGLSISLDGGTTSAALARAIALRAEEDGMAGRPPKRLSVVTNSMSVIDIIGGAEGVELFILPGRFRHVTRAVVGPQTIEAIAAHHVDVAFLGTNGLSAEGVSTPDHDEAATKSAFVGSGRRVVVLADSSKFTVRSLVRFAELDRLTTVITDSAPAAHLSAALDNAKVEVITS